MKTNEVLQSDVQNALKYEPLLSAAEIGVTAVNGIITLTGTVDRYAKKLEAESAATKVDGVKAVVEKIEVRFGSNWHKNDTDIAKEIIDAFKWSWEIPEDKVKVKVEDGYVLLLGELRWNYQREAAKKAVSQLPGVKAVTNDITIKSETEDMIEKDTIERALIRNWSIDEQDINVKVSDHKVTLAGKVDSLYQRDEAEKIAWKAPGVWSVNNELVIK